MTRMIDNYPFQDVYEYHGSTAIERIRKAPDGPVMRQWLYFDTVGEAQLFFNEAIGTGGSHAESAV